VQFFYLQGERNENVSFSDPDGNLLFELIVISPSEGKIPSDSIYVVSESQLYLVAMAIEGQFGGSVKVKSFSHEFLKDNNLIKPVLLGKSSIFGKENIVSNPLSNQIIKWKEENKPGISIALLGGYGSDHTRALISSSVMSIALAEIQTANITVGVDSYVEKNKPETLEISPYLQPVNTTQGYPLSLDFLNGYDAIWVTDEKCMEDLGIESCKNYHDFYAEIFGIKNHGYRNIFLVNQALRETLKETIVNLKDNLAQKVILIDFNRMDDSYASRLAKEVSERYKGSLIVSLKRPPDSVDVDILNLEHLSSDLSSKGCLISLFDGVIGLNSFYIHLAAVYGVPTILLTRSSDKGIMNQYYQHVEVLTDMDDLFTSKEVMSEFSRFENSVKSLWNLFENAKKEHDENMNNESKDVSEDVSEDAIEKRPKKNKRYFLLVIGLFIGAGVGFLLSTI
jgi:hypothetical protein